MKKRFLLILMALMGLTMAAYADSRDKTNPTVDRYNVTDADGRMPFGKSYYELDGKPSGANGNFYDPEHSGWSMKGWPDARKHVATYLHFPACQSDAQIQLTTSGAVRLRVIVTSCEDGTLISDQEVDIPAGAKQWVSVMQEKQMPRAGWYKFDFECLSGATSVGEFFYWQFSKPSTAERIYTADYMSSPSVHLSGWKTTDPNVPAAGRYDWVYQEVMLPESSTVVGTYCMSLGILHGYMGIQVDSENDYPIIFSMWDNGSTDSDPNLPDYLRSGALDNEEGVIIARFGGEGTGAQAKRRYGKNWVPGQWVRFITNCRPEVVDVEIDDPDRPGEKKTITYHNTLCSAWYMAEGKDTEWQYIATIRQSGANNYFDGWYSFLENYNWPSGQWQRKAYYRNGGLHSMVDGKWYHANKVGFGHTDGGNKYGDRQDYGQGQTDEFDNCFFMSTGGYHDAPVQNSAEVPLITDFLPVTDETLAQLTARVEQAIRKEQEKKLAEEFEKAREQLDYTGFKVVANNSEADNEGAKNRATAILDGDENTYWHTRWSSGSGNGTNQWPYTIDIQVADEQMAKEISQIALYQGRGSDYRAKTVKVQVSNTRMTWTTLGTYTLADTDRPVIDLETPITGRPYIRLNFTAGYGRYVMLNEVYFRTAISRDGLNDKVEGMLAQQNHFGGYGATDLQPLRDAYNGGQWEDAQTIKEAMTQVAARGTVLKFGSVNNTNALSSFKAYQIHNHYGLGELVISQDRPALGVAEGVDVTSYENNWLVLRSEKWNAYYLYNVAAQRYLTAQGGQLGLSEDPSPVTLTTREITLPGGKSTAFGLKVDVSSANGNICATDGQLTLGAGNGKEGAWELRDNYGVTPDPALVRQLLAQIEENGIPTFKGEGYAIRLNRTDLYLTTIEVKDNNTTTYSLSTNPEYFTLTPSGTGYIIQSATTGKYVGYSNTTSWDISNEPDVWQIADLETGTSGIYKSGTSGLGVDNKTAGSGVYTNKTMAKWIFEYVDNRPTAVQSAPAEVTEQAPLYDLQGRPAPRTQPGHIYVQQGRKVRK